MDDETTDEARGGRRPFLLMDGVFLVAAAAPAFSSERAVRAIWTTWDPMASYNEFNVRTMAATLAAVVFGLALLIRQSSRAEDRRRLRAGAPGLLVPWLVTTALLIPEACRLARSLLHAAIPGIYAQDPWARSFMSRLLFEFRFDAATAVAAGWLALALTGRWRPDPGWDDRLGRCVGALWLLYAVGSPLLDLLR